MSDHRGVGWAYIGEGIGMASVAVGLAIAWVLVMNTFVIGSAIARWIGGGP